MLRIFSRASLSRAIEPMSQSFRITLLPGDGIGPEIMTVAVNVLK
ncbi:MAG: 3-isopropylmalate dehydrogenase, partial [Cyanobacteria bacterium J06635_11]